MNQEESATLCAESLSFAAGRNHSNMVRMEADLAELESVREAIEFYRKGDDDVFTAIRNLLNHHLTGIRTTWEDGKPVKTSKYDYSAADATWRMARLEFSALCHGDGELATGQQTAQIMRETRQVLKNRFPTKRWD